MSVRHLEYRQRPSDSRSTETENEEEGALENDTDAEGVGADTADIPGSDADAHRVDATELAASSMPEQALRAFVSGRIQVREESGRWMSFSQFNADEQAAFRRVVTGGTSEGDSNTRPTIRGRAIARFGYTNGFGPDGHSGTETHLGGSVDIHAAGPVSVRVGAHGVYAPREAQVQLPNGQTATSQQTGLGAGGDVGVALVTGPVTVAAGATVEGVSYSSGQGTIPAGSCVGGDPHCGSTSPATGSLNNNAGHPEVTPVNGGTLITAGATAEVDVAVVRTGWGDVQIGGYGRLANTSDGDRDVSYFNATAMATLSLTPGTSILPAAGAEGVRTTRTITANQITVLPDGSLGLRAGQDLLPTGEGELKASYVHAMDRHEQSSAIEDFETTSANVTTFPLTKDSLAVGEEIHAARGGRVVAFTVNEAIAQRFHGEIPRLPGSDVVLPSLGGATFLVGDVIQQLDANGAPIASQEIAGINPTNGSFTIPANRIDGATHGFRVVRNNRPIQQTWVVDATPETAPASDTNFEGTIPGSVSDLRGFHVYDGSGNVIAGATLDPASRRITIPGAFFTGNGPWTVRVSRTPTSQPAHMMVFTRPAEVTNDSAINGGNGATYIVRANNPANFILNDPSGTNRVGEIQSSQGNQTYSLQFIGANGSPVGDRIPLATANQANMAIPLEVTAAQLTTARVTLTPGSYRLRIIAMNADKQSRAIDLPINAMNRPFVNPTFLHATTVRRPADAYTYANDAIRVQFDAPAGGFPAGTRVALRLVNANDGQVLQHPSGFSSGNIVSTITLAGERPIVQLTAGRTSQRDRARGEAGSIVIGAPREARVQWAVLRPGESDQTPNLQWRNLDHPARQSQGGTIIVGTSGRAGSVDTTPRRRAAAAR